MKPVVMAHTMMQQQTSVFLIQLAHTAQLGATMTLMLVVVSAVVTHAVHTTTAIVGVWDVVCLTITGVRTAQFVSVGESLASAKLLTVLQVIATALFAISVC